MTAKAKKIVRRRLPADMYGRCVTVLFGSIAQINDVLRVETPDEFRELPDWCNGHWKMYTHDGYQADYICILAGLGPVETPAVVAHEALHMVSHALRNAGLAHTDDTEEAYTYYLMWIVREVLKAINGK